MTRFQILLGSLGLWLGVSAGVSAQSVTGTILGAATDESGAPMRGVSITLTNVETSATRVLITDAAGRYRAPGLTLGRYEVRAELSGFQPRVHRGIVLNVGSENRVDFTLNVGHVTEEIVVEAETPLVNSTESTLSYLVDEKKIRDMPLNGRDFSQLILLQPGVVVSRASTSSANTGQGLKISVAGGRTSQNLFTLDGTAYNDALNHTPASAGGVMTGVETIKEFRVITNTMSAEYGRAGGGVFNVVTKSGTNEFRGSLFEFFRDDALDSRNYFDDEKTEFRRHQFGGSLGGPLVRNKMFFFVSYEGLRETKGTTQLATVPDDDARRGILPGRAPITIPAAILPYLTLFPVANGPRLLDARGQPTGVAEYRAVLDRHSDQDFAMVRLDHILSPRDSLFVRYLFDDSVRDEPVNFPQFPNIARNRKHLFTLEERRIFSSNLINELRLGFNHSRPNEDVNPVNPFTELAFVPGQMFGELAVTGITEIGTDRNNPKEFGQKLFQAADNLYVIRGRHAIKTGFDFEHFRFDAISDSRSRGRLRFRSLADFLSGVTQQFEIARPGSDFERHFRQSLFGLYVQDDFKPADRLTLNLGLRWEFVTTPEERDGKVSNLRNITDPQVTVGNPLFDNPTRKQVAPRLGFVWDTRGNAKTVVRAGFGIFYEQPLFNVYRAPSFRAVPFADRAVISRPALPISLASLAAAGVPENETMTYDLKPAYMTQWNVNLQQELPFQSVISLAYVGSRGHDLMGSGDINTARPTFVNGVEFYPAGLTRRNPNFGTVRSQFQGFRSQYKGFHAGLLKRRSSGLQLQASYTYGDSRDNRSSQGGRQESRSGQARAFDPYNIDLDWGRSDFDVRHSFAFNVSYDLPFGTSSFGQGWQVNALGTFASGVPFTPIIPGDPDRDLSSDNVGRPNAVPGVSTEPAGGRSADQWFNPAAFAFPGAGFRGTSGRNVLEGPGLAVVDLSLVKTQKLSGRVGLQFRLEVFNVFDRANLDIPFNDADGAAVFNEQGQLLPDAGKIFSTITDAREAQLALRLIF